MRPWPIVPLGAALAMAGCLPSFDDALLCQEADDALACGESGAGTCRDGTCCGGCWDGSACHQGATEDRCGAGGAFCTACGEDERCQRGACVPELGVGRVSAGRDTTCAIDDEGILWCWGSNERGQTGHGGTAVRPVERAVRWTEVDVGRAWRGHACAIRTDGDLYCWGNADAWAPGTSNTEAPVRVVSPGPRWTDVTAGTNFTCGVRVPGSLWCWGRNSHEKLGIPNALTDEMGEQTVPRQVGEGEDWRVVDVGESFGCALRRGDEGVLECWGANDHGQRGRTDGDALPAPVGEGFTAFAAGMRHACGVADGRLLCWGDNERGQVGQPMGEVETVPTPMPVDDAADWVAVAAGEWHTCATRSDGSLFCWGSNSKGQLGLGDAAYGMEGLPPTRVPGDQRWNQLAAGQQHTCGLTVAGVLYCWGSGSRRQTGVTSFVDSSRPRLLELEQ